MPVSWNLGIGVDESEKAASGSEETRRDGILCVGDLEKMTSVSGSEETGPGVSGREPERSIGISFQGKKDISALSAMTGRIQRPCAESLSAARRKKMNEKPAEYPGNTGRGPVHA